MGMIIKRQREEGFSYDLLSDDGIVICRSDMFQTGEECQNSVKALQKFFDAEIEDQTEEGNQTLEDPKYVVAADGNEFIFCLLDDNGSTVIQAKGFATKQSCLNAIKEVKQNVPNSEVISPTYSGDSSSFVAGQSFRV